MVISWLLHSVKYNLFMMLYGPVIDVFGGGSCH